jgi:ABC-type glycerol-3-phosphate transport system substrate-binding protein
MRFKLTILLLLFTLVVTSGFGCSLLTSEVKNAMKPITLNYWGVFNDEKDIKAIIDKYKQVHPYVDIKFRKWRYEEYEQAL